MTKVPGMSNRNGKNQARLKNKQKTVADNEMVLSTQKVSDAKPLTESEGNTLLWYSIKQHCSTRCL